RDFHVTGVQTCALPILKEVLLAGLSVALSRWHGGTATVVDLEGHGREEHLMPGADLSRTVGWFTTLYPVLLDTGPVDWGDASAKIGRASCRESVLFMCE